MGVTLHGVLDGRSSQEQSIAAIESQECFPPYAGRVLDVLRFIKDHILPFYALEVLLILGNLCKNNQRNGG